MALMVSALLSAFFAYYIRGRGRDMNHELDGFIEFIKKEKQISLNTELSYRRDLLKLCKYEAEHGVNDVSQLKKTNLTSFILNMEEQGFSPATISRTIASVKSFVAYLVKTGKLSEDISVVLKAPKVEKKKQQSLSSEEMFLLLDQPDTNTSKGIRDKAMLELLYSTGIRVSQITELKLEDVNLKLGYVQCNNQTLSMGREAQKSLAKYITDARGYFVKAHTSNLLFFNCSGASMSRQGFWKMLKGYAKKAGIESEITPHTIRNSMR